MDRNASAWLPSNLPQCLDDHQARSLMSGYDVQRALVMDVVSRFQHTPGSRARHLLLKGHSGFGKSFMLRYVRAALSVSEKTSIKLLNLPEGTSDRCRSATDVLDLISELAVSHPDALDERHFLWPDGNTSLDSWRSSCSRAKNAIQVLSDKGSDRVILLIDDLDRLVDRFFKTEIERKRLNAWFRSIEKHALVLAAARTKFVGASGFSSLNVVRLSGFGTEDSVDLINKVRFARGLGELNSPQLDAVRKILLLSDGSPATSRCIADLLIQNERASYSELLGGLLDRLSERFASQINHLSPLARGTFDALVRSGERVSQVDLSNLMRAGGQNRIARVMSELQAKGVVYCYPSEKGRSKLYYVGDRLLVHYYQATLKPQRAA